MAESADALALKAGLFGGVGSTPTVPTCRKKMHTVSNKQEVEKLENQVSYLYSELDKLRIQIDELLYSKMLSDFNSPVAKKFVASVSLTDAWFMQYHSLNTKDLYVVGYNSHGVQVQVSYRVVDYDVIHVKAPPDTIKLVIMG